MPRKKLEITASEKQIEDLRKALTAGSPLHIALQYAGISPTTYYYWVAMYSIVLDAQSQKELMDLKADKFGVSIDTIKDVATSNSPKNKSEMSAYIEPSAESMLQYKNDAQFRVFAYKCYEIVDQCNKARAGAAITQLALISKSVTDKRVNASGAMWFLERSFSEFFAKPSDKAKEEEINKVPVEKVQVEFIDSNTKEYKDRIKNMEELILNEQKAMGDS